MIFRADSLVISAPILEIRDPLTILKSEFSIVFTKSSKSLKSVDKSASKNPM